MQKITIPAQNVQAALTYATYGNQYFAQANYELALANFEKAREYDPYSIAALRGIGFVLQKRGQHAESLPFFDGTINLNPKDAEAHLYRAYALHALGKLVEASRACDAVLDSKPNAAIMGSACFVKGIIFAQDTQHEHAIAWFDTALKVDLKQSECLRQKGNSLIKLNRLQEALDTFDLLLQINPKDASAYAQKGEILCSGFNKIGDALACFDEALKINPKDANTQAFKAKAMEQYKAQVRASAIDPAAAPLLTALNIYNERVNANPFDINSYVAMGFLFNHLGRFTEALSSFDAALKLNANNADISLSTAEANSIGLASKCNLNNADIQGHRAKILYQLEHYQLALDACDEVLKRLPKSNVIHNRKANIYCALMQWESAKNSFKIADDLNPAKEELEAMQSNKKLRPDYLLPKEGLEFVENKLREAKLLLVQQLSFLQDNLKRNPLDGNMHASAGFVLSELGRFSEALSYFDAALKLNFNDENIQLSKARALYQLEKYSEALSACDEALKKDANLIAAHNRKANICCALKQWENAKKSFEIARKLNPPREILDVLQSNKKLRPDYLLPEEGLKFVEEKLKEAKSTVTARSEPLVTALTALKIDQNANSSNASKTPSTTYANLFSDATDPLSGRKPATKANLFSDAPDPLGAKKTTASAVVEEKATAADSGISNSYQISYEKLTFGEELGKGGFGIVVVGTYRYQKVAIKRLNQMSEKALKDFKKEAEIMGGLHSTNLVRLLGYCEKPQPCLVMEYMPKGSLYGILHSTQTLGWPQRMQLALGAAYGLAFLHEENIVHRDIKSLNVLVNDQWEAKLSDFGLSTVKQESQSASTSTQGSVGTISWMAPELFDRNPKYTKPSDIYSFGMLLWELATRKVPFQDVANTSVIISLILRGECEVIPSDCPKKLASLITFCWKKDAKERPTAAQVVASLQDAAADFSSAESQQQSQPSLSTTTTTATTTMTSSYRGNLFSS